MQDPKETAQEVGLRYVTDKVPGIRRKRRGKGFTYQDESSNTKIDSEKILERIQKLVIPPAWEDVWICKFSNGHLQVTGFDKKRRKQYRYHEKWNVERNQSKFTRLVELGKSIGLLRSRIELDLKQPGLPRSKVVAAVVKLMFITQTRIGNALYAEENESYGLTTILNEHAEIEGSTVKLSFKGKSGVDHDISFSDKTLSKIIARCQELPGEELFCYMNGDEVVDINSSHVNEYLKDVTHQDFTAKDIRTWSGSCKALELMIELGPPGKLTQTKWKKRHLEIVRGTALHLRNTVSVCRKYYIHPSVFEADSKGKLLVMWKKCRSSKDHTREEKLLLELLKDVA